MPDSKVRIFVSYSHDDERWVRDKYAHAIIPWLQRMLRKRAEFWFDRTGLIAGDEFKSIIERQIDESQIAILLISPSFFASAFIEEVELPRIVARGQQLVVIPILVEPAEWQETTFLASRQFLPGKPTPLIDYTDSDKNWVYARSEILTGINRQIDRILGLRGQIPARPIPDSGSGAEMAIRAASPSPDMSPPRPGAVPSPGHKQALLALCDWLKDNNKFGPDHRLVTDVSEKIDGLIQNKMSLSIGIGPGLTKNGKPYLLTIWHESFLPLELTSGQGVRANIGPMSMVAKTSPRHDEKIGDSSVLIEDLIIEGAQSFDPAAREISGSLRVRKPAILTGSFAVCISYQIAAEQALSTVYKLHYLDEPVEADSRIHFRFADSERANENTLTFPAPLYAAICEFYNPAKKDEYRIASNTLAAIVDSPGG